MFFVFGRELCQDSLYKLGLFPTPSPAWHRHCHPARGATRTCKKSLSLWNKEIKSVNVVVGSYQSTPQNNKSPGLLRDSYPAVETSGVSYTFLDIIIRNQFGSVKDFFCPSAKASFPITRQLRGVRNPRTKTPRPSLHLICT